MADPVTIMGAVSLGTTVAGGLLQAKGQQKQAEAKSSTYQYQAGVAEFNRKMALKNRDYALAAGETEAGRFGLQARQRHGSLVANRAASGLDVGSGSSTDVLASDREMARVDIATIRNNAARVAYGYAVESTGQGLQKGLYQKAAADELAAGKTNVASSLLSTASSVSSKWLQGQQVGLWGGKSKQAEGGASA